MRIYVAKESLFLASTLITGFPCRQKRRRSLWIWANCVSRRGCLGPIFLRFTRSEKWSLRSKRATVRALTRMRNRSSCAAILALARRVHRKPLMGSPAVSGSSSLSTSALPAGFFFPPSCVRPRLDVLSPPPLLLPTTPAVPGPPCAHPLPETPLSCGRLHARVFELPSPHRDVDAAHPASCGTERWPLDRKSTRLNSSHRCISYAVFCLKKKNIIQRSST